jgi:signal transduction histidine kinase
MREKVQGNIANALFRRFILTGLILILISTAASVVLEYFRQRGAMRETAERIQEVDIVPIQEALWVADFYMLNTLLEALTRDRFVATAEVIEDGAILASAGTEARGPVRPHTYIMSYEYEGAPRYLGRLRLELNLAPVWSNALALGLAGSLYPTVAILVVGVVLFLGFHRSVVNPLMQIADYLRDFSVDYEPRPLELSPRGGHDDGDELTAIAAAVNALRDSLNHRYQQLLNANKRTEARVIEKTHELQLTNAALEREVGELERTKDELSEANRAKTLFLANISHEIRTPITGVVGLAKLLKNTRLDDQQQEYTSAIVDSASLRTCSISPNSSRVPLSYSRSRLIRTRAS